VLIGHHGHAEMVGTLGQLPAAAATARQDICHATTNRQDAVKRVAPVADAMIVVGSPNSLNSQRLTEGARRAGYPWAALARWAEDIDWERFGTLRTLGAGAAAPEGLVEDVLKALAARSRLEIETVSAAEESVASPLPRAFRAREAAD